MRGEFAEVASETAVIIWDAQAGTQHFIRSASFSSTVANFGFLVPTPTSPELAEATDEPFQQLAVLTAPRRYRERRADSRAGLKSAGAKSGVHVLERKRVGEYDAAVLRADDPVELRRWLAANGYDTRPELEGWLAAYTAKRWVVTAFKIAAEAATGERAAQPPGRLAIDGSTVRMSFQTDRPFFPYREPDYPPPDGGRGGRLLRVYVLADARYEGAIGDGRTRWPGRTVWANSVPADRFASVLAAGKLPEAAARGLAGRTWHLTEFEDRSSPRPGSDELYFERSADSSVVERPPVVEYVYGDDDHPLPWYCGLVFGTPLLMLFGVLVLRGLRRRPIP